MGILKTGLKLVGSAALGATGIASAFLRQCANVAGADELADAIGSIQDKSFDKIQDIWTSDDKKDDEYYQRQEYRHIQSAESSAKAAERKRAEYERMKGNSEK